MRAALPFTVVLAMLCVAGCQADLGKCDMNAATKVVYSTAGVPYYEGQAVVQQSCAGSFCHAAGAKNASRFGVPHGLDFDVTPLTAMSSTSDLHVLSSGIKRVRDQAPDLYDLVDSGEMPPGKVGERPLLPWKTLDASKNPTVDTKVPDVHDGAGKEVLRNWLACDAPIIAGVKGAPAGAEKLGDIKTAGDVVVDPTFDSIFANVLSDTCVGCHNGSLFTDMQALDFSSKTAAYASLVGQDAFSGGACDGGGKLVVAGDCEASVLFQKVNGSGQGGAKLCGTKMPLGGGSISSSALDAVCEWIDSGAVK